MYTPKKRANMNWASTEAQTAFHKLLLAADGWHGCVSNLSTCYFDDEIAQEEGRVTKLRRMRAAVSYGCHDLAKALGFTDPNGCHLLGGGRQWTTPRSGCSMP